MKRLFLGAAALLTCAAAHSQSATWTFTYTGFYDNEGQVYRPDLTLKGEFTGADLDADGVIERTELSGFQLFHGFFPLDLLNCPTVYPDSYGCTVERFFFSEAAGLDFSGDHYRSNMHTGNTEYLRVATGISWVTGHYSGRAGSEPGSSTFFWTPQTSLSIVSSVPEPGQATLLALGLGALAFGGLRRARRLRYTVGFRLSRARHDRYLRRCHSFLP